jgi:hypothetical protein
MAMKLPSTWPTVNLELWYKLDICVFAQFLRQLYDLMSVSLFVGSLDPLRTLWEDCSIC